MILMLMCSKHSIMNNIFSEDSIHDNSGLWMIYLGPPFNSSIGWEDGCMKQEINVVFSFSLIKSEVFYSE